MWLQMAEFAYNHAPYALTKITPFKAAYGYVPALPQLANVADNSSVVAVEEHLKALQDL
jgi:hypothetical protein